ncbi:MAG TPA: NADH-ubiquinone oxidoreductase-F iron-sulfur binding region domain-containing protein [Streptosporangiaceae bacterium]|nr:NADH-ubiquinone oxidoreductase-F iron-sulfur binding region domain-containing protein [Streptosporangiaceae bacterium]
MTSPGAPEVMCIGQARMTAGLDRVDRIDLTTHYQVFGSLPRLTADQLIGMAEQVDLRGRGGAAFPVARKVRSVLETARRRRRKTVVLVNGSEGEPGSAKDRMLMLRSPYLVLGGALVAARALQAKQIVIGVTRPDVARSVASAAQAEPDLRRLVRVVRVPDRFVTGEGGALVNALNGKPALPPGRKVLPSDYGIDDLPTMLSNAETYAQIAVLAMLGPEGFASTGTPDEPGTYLLTVGGSAERPAVVEVPAGLPLGEVLDLCLATPWEGVLVGGYHGMWLPTETAYNVPVSRAGLTAAGGVLGTGIVLPLGEGTCPMGEVARVAGYLAKESSGQCGPCKLGLPSIARALTALADGSGGVDALDTARRGAAAVRGRGACAHPDGVFRFVLSAIDVFADDLTAHLFRGTCGRRVQGVLPMPAEGGQTKLSVDWTRCRGHGLCAHLVPELVQLDGQGYPVFLDMPVPPWLRHEAQQAVQMCPSLALRLVTPPAAPAAPPREPARAKLAAKKGGNLKLVASKPSSESDLAVDEAWIADLSDVGRQIPGPIT